MQIGFVEQRQMAVGKDENDQPEIAQWLEMVIKAPGLREFSLKLQAVQPEQGKRMPAFKLFHRSNTRKNEKYRDLNCGALWHEVSSDQQTQYLSGHIESPVIPGGKLRIALFQSKPLYEGEQVNWIYDVIWSPEKPQQQNDDYTPQYGEVVPMAICTHNPAGAVGVGNVQSPQAQQPGYFNEDGSPMNPQQVAQQMHGQR